MATRTHTPNAKRHPDSPQAAILFTSRHPKSEEPKLYSEHYPATSLFHTGPTPGFTVSDPPQPQEPTWAQVPRKGSKGKKSATAAQVAASSKSIVPKGPAPLPAAQGRFFAPHTSPTLPNHSFIMTAALPDIMAAVLKEANCSVPLSLTASVNRNGAVTLKANTYTPSSAYSPFFDAMTKKLNQSFPVGNNPFQVFREAPTSVEPLIHNLPLSMLPHERTDLFPSLLESISNAIDVTIFGARFLQLDPVKRAEKRTTSVVVAVDILSMFPGSANPYDLSPAPVLSPPPTLPPNPRSAKSAGVLVTLLLYAKKRHMLARSALSSITAPPTDVLSKAAQKGALRCWSWVAAMPPRHSVSTVVVSKPLSMAHVPSAAKSSPLSILLGTKSFPIPLMWASPKPLLRVQLCTQLYRRL